MSSSPAPLIARVSRRDLARNPSVWGATGGMTLFLSVTVGIFSMVAYPEPVWDLVGVALVCLVAGIFLLRSQPPDIGTRVNHFVIAVPYVASAGMFWGSAASAGIAVGAAMFISPLAAVRLQNRKHFFAHLVAATVLLASAGAIGQLPYPSLIGILCSTLAIWVLGISCWEILQSAEAQGDELERLVRRDPLTGLGNLRLLDEALPEELQRHERANKPLTILCLDLTGSKALNDTMGHAEGDALLRDVGVALGRIARPIDTVVRQGGDEFCVILAETPAAYAVRTANAIRAALADLHFEGITTGIGMASFPEDATDARTLLHVGDERLLADKVARKPVQVDDHPRRRAADRPGVSDQAAPTGPTPLTRLGDRREEKTA